MAQASENQPSAQKTTAPPAQKASAAQSASWTTYGVVAFLLSLVWLAFSRTLHNGFVNFDDPVYVLENPHVQNGLRLQEIAWAFTNVWGANWHPLTWISHMLDCQLFGLNPAGHHLVNVAIHGASTVLLFLVLREMTGFLWRGAFVAAIFGVHPLHVESVAWIAERKDVLSGLFFMLTLQAYMRYVRSRPRTRRQYNRVLLFFVLGLLSKPMLVTVPFVLLLLDYWPFGRFQTLAAKQGERRAALVLAFEKLPFFLLSIGSCLITLLAQSKGAAISTFETVSLSARVGNAIAACATYLRQTVCPHGLTVLYPLEPERLTIWLVLPALLLLTLITVAVLRVRKTQPWYGVGWFWFVGMLAPVIGIVQVGGQSHADRYTYLPQIGLTLAVTWWVCDSLRGWRNRRRALGGGGCILLIAAVIAARAQVAYWHDSLSLWNRNLECAHENWVAHHDLGIALGQQGRMRDALEHYRKAIALNPKSASVHNSIGNICAKLGHADEAVFHFQKALEIKPDLAEARVSLAYLNLETGKRATAISEMEQIVQTHPEDLAAHFVLGKALLETGKAGDAIPHLQQAVRTDPPYAERCDFLGCALEGAGRHEEAIVWHRKAVELAPKAERAYNNLGFALLQAGRAREAIAPLTRAIELNQNYAIAFNNLGNALLQIQRPKDAIVAYGKAIQSQPDYAEATANLGNALMQVGRVREAITQYKLAIDIRPAYARAHANLGMALIQSGLAREAVPHLEKALELQPRLAGALRNLAWVKAACPDASLRDGSKALELARQAVELGGASPAYLRSLAAALAETGQFSKAIETAERAIGAAGAEPSAVAELRAQLQRYKANSPVRDQTMLKPAP